jgi:hypothetical protein
MLLKPISRRFVRLLTWPARGRSLATAIWIDAVLTLTLFPLALVTLVGCAIATVAVGQPQIVLPIVFLVLAIVVSDVVTRDRRGATLPIIYASPRLRENLVWWKLGSTSVLALLFCLAPIVLSTSAGGVQLAALIGGVLFVAASATSLGVITGNPKTFIVGFLSFWYVVVNGRGASPLLDFAGFYGTATPRTVWLYATISVVAIVAAQVAHRVRLTRA